jgi:hypothetical protein
MKQKENKSVSVNVRYTMSEYKELQKKATKLKLFRGEHNKIPCLTKLTRMMTLGEVLTD